MACRALKKYNTTGVNLDYIAFIDQSGVRTKAIVLFQLALILIDYTSLNIIFIKYITNTKRGGVWNREKTEIN